VVIGQLLTFETQTGLGVSPGEPAGPSAIFERHLLVDTATDITPPDDTKIPYIEKILPTALVVDVVEGIRVMIADNDTFKLIGKFRINYVGLSTCFDTER